MRREIDFEKLFQYIKQNIIEAEGIVENDLEYDSEYDFDELEDQVNFWARVQFQEICGFEYDDLGEYQN
jgi:hypothetical protein